MWLTSLYSVFSFLKKNWWLLALIGVGVLVLFLWGLWGRIEKLKAENDILSENVYQLQDSNQVLHIAYDDLNTEYRGRVDSLALALNVKPKNVYLYERMEGNSRIDTILRLDTIFSESDTIFEGEFFDGCTRVGVKINDSLELTVETKILVERALVREKKLDSTKKHPKTAWFFQYFFRWKKGYRLVLKEVYTCPRGVQSEESIYLELKDLKK